MTEFDDFTFGERLPPETRMEIPGCSYEQELLAMPVPFVNRVEFLSDYVKPTARCESVPLMARHLGVTPERVVIMAEALGAKAQLNQNGVAEYELFTREVIEEEIAWQALFDSLAEELSAYAIAEYLAKSEGWVMSTAARIGIYSEEKSISENRVGHVYHKQLVGMLRTIIMHTPPANDLYSMDEILDMLGHSRKWVERMVREHNLATEVRTLAVSRKEGIHYPQETVDALRALVPSPAADWLTITHLEGLVGKYAKWIRPNLGVYAELAQIRQTDNGRMTIHYPPETVVYLREKIANLPITAGDWVTEGKIAEKLTLHHDAVRRSLVPYQHLAEIRLTNNGNRPLIHYPPEVLDYLSGA